MEEVPPGRGLVSVVFLVYLALFAAQAWGVSRWTASLERSTTRLDAYAVSLDKTARREVALHKDISAQSRDIEFLQGLPNILPRDKGYLRTQKAISGDVETLRRKLQPRLKGVLHILIDAKANKLYLKKGAALLWSADCSVGRGGVLVDKKTGRRWEFVTPRGEFKVIAKGENPLWRKPDWAYVESKEPPPPPDDPSRMTEGELGAFVLNLGDGYLIHGTKNEETLGRPASHGCVRLGAEDLKKLYEIAPLGTRVFIFY